jgi:hypothetical protein
VRVFFCPNLPPPLREDAPRIALAAQKSSDSAVAGGEVSGKLEFSFSALCGIRGTVNLEKLSFLFDCGHKCFRMTRHAKPRQGEEKPDQKERTQMKMNYSVVLPSVCFCAVFIAASHAQTLQPSGGLNNGRRYFEQQPSPRLPNSAIDGSTFPFISGLPESKEYKAAFTACKYLKQKMSYIFSGDSCVIAVYYPPRGRGPEPEPPPNIEYAKLSVVVKTTFNEADRLNGEEWRGTVYLKAEATRLRTAGSKWSPVENPIATISVYLKDGSWFVGN